AGSLAKTGLVGAAQAIALVVLSPLGGAYADRLDRRRLLQCSQGLAMAVSAALSVLSLAGSVTTWEGLASVPRTCRPHGARAGGAPDRGQRARADVRGRRGDLRDPRRRPCRDPDRRSP